MELVFYSWIVSSHVCIIYKTRNPVDWQITHWGDRLTPRGARSQGNSTHRQRRKRKKLGPSLQRLLSPSFFVRHDVLGKEGIRLYAEELRRKLSNKRRENDEEGQNSSKNIQPYQFFDFVACIFHRPLGKYPSIASVKPSWKVYTLFRIRRYDSGFFWNRILFLHRSALCPHETNQSGHRNRIVFKPLSREGLRCCPHESG